MRGNVIFSVVRMVYMGKRIAIICFICIWIVLSALSCCFVAQKSVHEIQNVNTVNYQDGYLYGIDMDADKYYIFRVNIETGEQKFFTYPIKDQNGLISMKDLICGKNGELYVYYKQLPTAGTQTAIENIAYCDFDAKRLDMKWNLKEILENPYFYYWCTETGDLMMASYNSDTNLFQQFQLNEDGTADEVKHFQIQEEVYSMSVGDNGVWAISIYGDVNMLGNDGSTKRIFTNDGSKIGTQNTYYLPLEDGLHFFNADTGKNYKITKETNFQTIEPCDAHDAAHAESFDVSDVNILVIKDGIYAGTLALEDGRTVPVVYGEKEFVLEDLSWSAGKTVVTAFLLVIGITVLLGMYFYIFYRMLKRRNGAPVLGIAVMLILPIIAISLTGLFYAMGHQFPDEKELKLQQLTVINDMIKERVHLQWLESTRNEEMNTKEEAKKYYYTVNQFESVRNMETGSDELINNEVSADVYYYMDGELFSTSLSYQLNLPMRYQVKQNIYAAMEEAVEKGQIVSTEYNDYSNRYLTVFSPIKNDKGEVIGVLETKENILLLEMNILSNNQTIKRLFFVAGTFVFLLSLLVFWINTRSLKTVRQAMTRMAEGDLHARANIQGNHEIAVIAKKFDHMAELIENRVEEMETFQRKYEAFVPSKPFYLLRKNGIRGALAGDGKDFTATVLTINTAKAQSGKSNPYQHGFSVYNKYLSKQIPIIHAYGGVVNKIFRYGEDAIFTKEIQNQAVECAIAVMEKLKDANAEFYAGIAEEELRFGVIGLQKRMVTAMIAEHGSLSLFMQQMAAKFGTPILITGKAASKVENFSKSYRTRMIGYLYMTSSNRLEVIYEVLNADSQERQRLKLDTKSEFEDGIRLFMAKSYAYARRRFIHVLQQDPKDGVAKEYILLCEQLMHKENTEPWLDRF